MGYFNEKLRTVIDNDRYVSEHNRKGELRAQDGIILISAAAYMIMSVLNAIQSSEMMLMITGGCSGFLIILYLITRVYRNISFSRAVYLIINMIVLTFFELNGGNMGFATLWITFVPFLAMFLVDLKRGFFVSLYFFIMLCLTLDGPLGFLVKYDYEPMFRIRFPFLYFVDFMFAVFITVRSRKYQYELLIKGEELERISTTDMSTGLLNRNSFNRFCAGAESSTGTDTVCAVFMDVNGLHRIYNERGHEAGDLMLKTIADECLKNFTSDSVYRMGGDEILIIDSENPADKIGEMMRSMKAELENKDCSIAYGISVGAADKNFSRLVNEADREMLINKDRYYRMKNIEHR